MKSIFLGDAKKIGRVYPDPVIDALSREAKLDPRIITYDQLAAKADTLRQADFIFSTWGMPTLTEEEIKEYLPNLKAVFYAAGSVQYFARPFLNRGIRVFSAWCANAVPVAEYTVSQILLANKGFFPAARLYSAGEVKAARSIAGCFPGNYGCKVGLIGIGTIGKMVCEMLRERDIELLAYDPFLSEEQADALGVRLCSLEDIFSTCQTVSNHVCNNAQTVGMMNYSHFASMPKYATFINTGRGAQVVEADLIRALKERPDLTAVLDVTDPEPPVENSEWFALPNAILTPHIAGSSGDEVARMAQYMLEEFRSFVSNDVLWYEITASMLTTMA